MISLGIDIGGTSTKVAAVQEGRTLWTGQSPPYFRPDTAQLVSALKQAIGGHGERFDAAGICMPGLLDKQRRMITQAVNVPGLENVVLDDLIADALGYRVPSVAILNDAVATGYDVWDQERQPGRYLVLAIGTGVGAAVIDDGKILIVEGQSPGHIGQIDVSIEGEPVIGPDGGAGGLEGYLSNNALAKRYGGDSAAAVNSMRADAVPMRALVRAIRICHAIYRPQHIRLTGGIGIRLQRLLEPLHAAIGRDLTSVARPGWTLACGGSDYHAAAGAGKMAALQP